MASRREMAARFGISEATLRTAEQNGTLPPFSPQSADEYIVCVEVWQAARRGGASTQEFRRAIGATPKYRSRDAGEVIQMKENEPTIVVGTPPKKTSGSK